MLYLMESMVVMKNSFQEYFMNSNIAKITIHSEIRNFFIWFISGSLYQIPGSFFIVRGRGMSKNVGHHG